MSPTLFHISGTCGKLLRYTELSAKLRTTVGQRRIGPWQFLAVQHEELQFVGIQRSLLLVTQFLPTICHKNGRVYLNLLRVTIILGVFKHQTCGYWVYWESKSYGCESKCKAPIHTLNPHTDPYPRSIPKCRWSRPIHTSGSPRADPYPNFDANPYVGGGIWWIWWLNFNGSPKVTWASTGRNWWFKGRTRPAYIWPYITSPMPSRRKPLASKPPCRALHDYQNGEHYSSEWVCSYYLFIFVSTAPRWKTQREIAKVINCSVQWGSSVCSVQWFGNPQTSPNDGIVCLNVLIQFRFSESQKYFIWNCLFSSSCKILNPYPTSTCHLEIKTSDLKTPRRWFCHRSSQFMLGRPCTCPSAGGTRCYNPDRILIWGWKGI